MNNAQITNLAVTVVMTAFGATVAKLGIDPTRMSSDIGDLVALIIAGIAAFKAHQFHGKNPPPTPK